MNARGVAYDKFETRLGAEVLFEESHITYDKFERERQAIVQRPRSPHLENFKVLFVLGKGGEGRTGATKG